MQSKEVNSNLGDAGGFWTTATPENLSLPYFGAMNADARKRRLRLYEYKQKLAFPGQ